MEQAIIDALLEQLDSSRPRNWARFVSSLPVGYAAVYATWSLESEIENGGFLQYFHNSASDLAELASESLRRMSAVQHAELLEAAVNQLLAEHARILPLWQEGTPEAFLQSCEISKVPSFDADWHRLEPIAPLRLRYIRTHPGDFRSRWWHGLMATVAGR